MVVFQNDVSMFNIDEDERDFQESGQRILESPIKGQYTNNLLRRPTKRLLGGKRMSMGEESSFQTFKLPLINRKQVKDSQIREVGAPEPDWRAQILNQAAKDEVYLRNLSAYSSQVREEIRSTIKNVKCSIRASSQAFDRIGIKSQEKILEYNLHLAHTPQPSEKQGNQQSEREQQGQIQPDRKITPYHRRIKQQVKNRKIMFRV
eukprot:403370564